MDIEKLEVDRWYGFSPFNTPYYCLSINHSKKEAVFVSGRDSKYLVVDFLSFEMVKKRLAPVAHPQLSSVQKNLLSYIGIESITIELEGK